MKNWERFKDWSEAWQYYEKNCVPALKEGRGRGMNVVLNLPIKGKWFDMIAYGGKREEYRDCEHRQVQRAYLWAANDQWWGLTKPVAIFRNGYSMKSRAMVVDIVGFDLRGRYNVKHPEWGEPKGRRLHLVVQLGTVLKLGKYCEAKEWLGKEK